MDLYDDQTSRVGARILVVDDDVLIREILADELTASGYEALGAGTADEALRILATGQINLVITDLRLPGRLDGASLSRIVAVDYQGLPLLMISGTRPDRDDLIAVAEFFAKPVDMACLCRRIDGLLDTALQKSGRPRPAGMRESSARPIHQRP